MDYKITDGTDIGVILKLKTGQKIWLFKEEVKGFDNELSIKKEQLYSTTNKRRAIPNKEISYIFNPINFLNWLISSLENVI